MTAHIGIVAGTEQLRDGDGKPIAHTDHKPENEIVHRTGGPHRRQCDNEKVRVTDVQWTKGGTGTGKVLGEDDEFKAGDWYTVKVYFSCTDNYTVAVNYTATLNGNAVSLENADGMPGMPARCNPETNVEYRNCKKLGEEIRQALTQVRKDVREKIEQAAAPKAAVTCPYCGATTTPDASGCCEYCGGAVNG